MPRGSKLITAVYKVNRQDKTRRGPDGGKGMDPYGEGPTRAFRDEQEWAVIALLDVGHRPVPAGSGILT